jgi:hypothetical protein
MNLRHALDVIQRRPRPMDSAPRDGTPILAHFHYPNNYWEWRQVSWNPLDSVWYTADGKLADDDLGAWLPAPIVRTVHKSNKKARPRQ